MWEAGFFYDYYAIWSSFPSCYGGEFVPSSNGEYKGWWCAMCRGAGWFLSSLQTLIFSPAFENFLIYFATVLRACGLLSSTAERTTGQISHHLYTVPVSLSTKNLFKCMLRMLYSLAHHTCMSNPRDLNPAQNSWEKFWLFVFCIAFQCLTLLDHCQEWVLLSP